jgi:DNA-directed RNA polymerase subunit M
MVDFCPECSNLLRKRTMNGETYFVCRCGYSRKIEDSKVDLEKDALKKKKALEKNLIILSKEDKIPVNPIVDKYCPKCGYKKAEAWQEQTRSADESSTSFFRCLKCKHTWREY